MSKKYQLVKMIALLLVVMLMVPVLGACGQGGKNAGGDTGSSGKNNEQQSGSGSQYPVVKQPLTLTMWTTLRKSAASMTDFNKMSAFQEMENATGIHIDFKHPPTGQERDQFNLMVASNDLPDLVWGGYFKNDTDALMNKQIIALNDLIAKHAPNYSKVLEKYPNLKKAMYTDEGQLVGFGFTQPFIEASGIGGPMLRKDWLDKLGLKIPATIDEWETVLTAFKEKDPNGNGKQDEIPYDSDKNGAIVNFAFAWGIKNDFYVEGGAQTGKIKYGPIEPAYKEFITKMHDWYKKGLLNKDYLTTDGKLRDANMTGNKTGATWGAMHGNLGNWVGLMRNDPNFLLWPTPFPKVKPDGKIFADQGRALSLIAGKGYITSTNKHPVESVKWFDWGYTQEGQMAFNFGKEGVSYKMVDGYPAYTDEIWKNPDGLSTANAIAKHCMANMEFAFVQHPAYVEQIVGSSPSQRQALKTWKTGWSESAAQNIALPPITLTMAEQAADKGRLNDITTYRDEMVDKFITGQESLENFDNFVKQLKTMGIEESVKVRQAALERWRKRGNVNFDPNLEKFTPNYKNVKYITEKGKDALDADLK